jgi:hypothetical protein
MARDAVVHLRVEGVKDPHLVAGEQQTGNEV